MFGIWESVYLYSVYIYISIYIHTIYETFQKRVRVLMFQYVTMSLFFFPQNVKAFWNYITNQSPIKNGKISMTRCFLLNITGNPNCFWVNQRLEPNPRLHGAFASDFECEMSARYEAYAENDVPWMFFFLKGFLETNASNLW